MEKIPFGVFAAEGYITLLRQILQKELAPVVEEYDRKGEFPMEVFHKLHEAGFFGAGVPEEYGGLGADTLTQYLINEELGKVDAGFGVSFFIGGDMFGILEAMDATKEMKTYIADRILSGVLGSFCLTEAGAGSNASAIRTSAVRDGDEWVLNGTKCFVTNGGIADMFIIAAVTDKSKGSKGISLFLVESKHGLQVGKEEDKMGIRLSNTTDLILEDVRIPAANLIGRENDGYRGCLAYLEGIRCLTMAFTVGIAQSALDYAVQYSKERTTFGSPIIKHQGLGFLLADVQINVHAARAILTYAASVRDRHGKTGSLSPSAKVFSSEICFKAISDALQVLGGYGYMREYPIEKKMRDARIFPIFEGTNQIQRMVIAGELARQT